MMNQTLNSFISAQAISAVRKPLAQASLLPPQAYSSQEIFAIERETLFAHQWLPVGHVSQLAEVGSYIGRTIVGEPVLAVRDRENQIHVYSNVCRHRNTTLLLGEGKCKGARVSCPYHGWTYGLDGRLLAAPFMDKTEGFNREDHSLPRIRTELWHGFIFINFDNDAPALSPQLSGLNKYIDGYEFEDRVAVPMTKVPAAWNWKLSLENFTEAYHQPWVHAKTAESFAPAKGARYYDNDGGPWSAFLIPHARDIEAFPTVSPTSKPNPQATIDPMAPPTSIDEGALVFNIYPYFHSLTTAHSTLWLDFSIDAVGQHELIWRVLFRKSDVKDGSDEELQRLIGFIGPVIDEDVGICTSVGRGSRSRLARAGRLSYMEKSVHQFHNWWLDAVDGAVGAGNHP
jgi:choline monooxygenase